MRFLVALALALLLPSNVLAVGTWSDNGFQWRTRAPFTLNVVDRTTGAWPARIALAAQDWSASPTADVVVNGKGGKIKVVVSNGYYSSGPCGWLTVTTTSGGYIQTAGLVLNDRCESGPFDPNFYRQVVTCQEIGHALGMPDHRTDVPGLPSCMSTQKIGDHPTQDDFDELAGLY